MFLSPALANFVLKFPDFHWYCNQGRSVWGKFQWTIKLCKLLGQHAWLYLLYTPSY